MSLFVLREFKMSLSQSEKLTRKWQTEAKCYKCIMEDPELHNTFILKCWKQYAAAKQKKER